MRRRIIFVSAALMALLLLDSRHLANAAPATLQIKSPDAGGLIVLSTGFLFAWNDKADVQIRSPLGDWRSIVHLPVSFLEGASADLDGALFLSEIVEARRLTSLIIRVDTSGRSSELFRFPNLPVTSLAVSNGKIWAAAGAGFVELKPNGTLGQKLDAEQYAILLGTADGGSIICVPGNSSMAHYSSPYCYSTYGARWKSTGDWTDPPFLCGSFVVEPAMTHFFVRAVSDGRIVSHRTVPSRSAMACGTDSDLLIGSKEVVDVSLPSLKKRWAFAIKEGPATALVRLKDKIVISTSHGTRVVFPPKF